MTLREAGARGDAIAGVPKVCRSIGAVADSAPRATSRFGASSAGILACTACLLGLAFTSPARAEFMLVGIDRKFADSQGKRQALEPGHDSLLLYDLENPAKPSLVGELALENSVVGPPANIGVTPDQKLALVANSVHSVRSTTGEGWVSVPANEVFVVDLTTRPIALIGTVRVGAQPSGLAIDRAGKFALVASRVGNSVSLLTIRGSVVTVTDTTAMGDTVTSVAITPDGRHALATKFLAHAVAQLAISPEGALTDEKHDLPVGLYPWNVAITPDGTRALVNDYGTEAASDGNAKCVTVVDLAAEPARVVQYVTVGDAPEGLAVSRKGNLAAVTLLQGSYDAPKGAWFRHDAGRVAVLRLTANGVSVVGGSDVGALPESVGISGDGRYVYVGNFADSTLSILAVDAGGAVNGREDMPLPGPPASLRVTGQ